MKKCRILRHEGHKKKKIACGYTSDSLDKKGYRIQPPFLKATVIPTKSYKEFLIHIKSKLFKNDLPHIRINHLSTNHE